MGRVVLNRVLWAVGVLVVLSFVTFLLLHVVPGDPAALVAGENASPETVARIRAELGLDTPFLSQYVSYLGQVVRGDLGDSLYTHHAVTTDLAQMAPVTIELVLASMALTLVVGLGLGLVSALGRGTWVDGAVRSLVIFFGGTPAFWVGMVLQLTVAARLGWLPMNGRIDFGTDPGRTISGMLLVDTAVQGSWTAFASAARHLVLPAVTLSLTYVPLVTRTIAASTATELSADYVTLGRAKGLSEPRLVTSYAMRNALLPTVTILGMQIGWMVGGTVLVESIFGLPGIGSYAVTAVMQKDLNAVVGVVMFVGVVFVLVNVLVDLLYAALNPKIRRSGGAL